MARVAVYQPQVRLRNAPGVEVRAPRDNGAGALAQGIDHAGDVAVKRDELAFEEQRQARLMNAYTLLGKERTDLETAAKGLEGEQALAVDLPGVVTDRLNEAAARIKEKLPEDVHGAFDKMLAQERDSLYGATSRHYADQAEKFGDESYKGVVATEARKAALAAPALPSLPPIPPGGTPHDLSRPIVKNEDGSISTELTATFELDGKHLVIPTIVDGQKLDPKAALEAYRQGKNKAVGSFASEAEANAYAQKRHEEEAVLRGAVTGLPELAASRKAVEDAVAARAAVKGWPKAYADAQRAAALTDLHASVIDTLRSPSVDRAADAKAYLDAHRSEMLPEKAAALDRELGPAALTDRARKIVDGIEALPTEVARVKAALAIPDEHLSKRVQEILHERAALLEHATEQDEKSRFGRVLDAIEKGAARAPSELERLPDFGGLTDTDRPRAREHLRQILASKRSEANQAKALAAEERRAAADARARAHEADVSAERDYLARPVEERAGMDVRVEYAGKVGSPDGINVMLAHQQRAKKEWDKDRGVSEGEFGRLIKTEAGGILTDKRDLDAFGQWMGKKRGAWLDEKGNEGKEPPREVVNTWLVEGLTRRDPGVLSSNRYGFELDDERRAETPVAAPDKQPYPRARGEVPAAAAQPAAVGVPPLLARPSEKAPPVVTSVEQIPADVLQRILAEYAKERPGQPAPPPGKVILRYKLGQTRSEWR